MESLLMPIADPPPDPPARIEQVQSGSFDLKQLELPPNRLRLPQASPRCAVGAGSEIVVCAPDPEENRLRHLPDSYADEEGLPRAQIGIGDGATLDLHLDSAAMSNGTVSNRIMAGVNIAF